MSEQGTPYEADAYTIAANAVEKIDGLFDYYEFVTLDAGLLVSVNSGEFVAPRAGFIQFPPYRVTSIAIKNPTGGSLSCTLATGVGQVVNTRPSDGQAIDVNAAITDGVKFQGMEAHDAAVVSNPHLVGATARTDEQAAVSEDDVARLVCDRTGRAVVAPYCLPEEMTDGSATGITSASGDTDVIAAGGAGIRTYITSILLSETAGTAGEVHIKIGGTVRLRVMLEASKSHPPIVLPVPMRGGANAAVQIDVITATTEVDVTAIGYQSAV